LRNDAAALVGKFQIAGVTGDGLEIGRVRVKGRELRKILNVITD
jgi:hypothetical protein